MGKKIVVRREIEMIKLGIVDLEILILGIKGDGNFNENDIENSSLKKLGVGRILDSLASLRDRKLISQNKDGSFFITDLARYTLWNEKIPLWVRILRLLEIKSCSNEEIAIFLRKQEHETLNEIENLRKNQLVLMSPQRIEDKINRVYEILPEGIEKLKDVETEGVNNQNLNNVPKIIEIQAIINQIIKEINDSELIQDKKENIVAKLLEVKNRLE